MRRVYLVRHGQTESDGRLNGWTDVGLSERGCRQAEALSRRCREWPIDHVVGSDLKRVKETAAAIVDGRRLQLETTRELRERHYGDWEGLSWTRIEEGWPSLSREYLDDFITASPPGGEAWNEMADRVSRAWRDIERRSWRCLLVIAHAGPNASLLCHLMGWPQGHAVRLGQDHACFSCLDLFTDSLPILRTLNHSP